MRIKNTHYKVFIKNADEPERDVFETLSRNELEKMFPWTASLFDFYSVEIVGDSNPQVLEIIKS